MSCNKPDNDDHPTSLGMLSVSQAARRAGVSPNMIYSLCNRKELPHYRLSSRIVIAEVDLDAYLASRRVEAATADEPPPPAPRHGDGFAAYYQNVMEQVARKRRR
jgi:excisionase family DNA binding protein